jgi:hypothetical protein
MHHEARKAVEQGVLALVDAAKKFLWKRLSHGDLQFCAIVEHAGCGAQNRRASAGLGFPSGVK